MFPIIHLPSQLEAINQAILTHKMTKHEVIEWLDDYGELIRPDEEHFQRYLSPFLGLSIPITKQVNAYIYRSNFGFLSILKIKPSSYQIVIRQSMDNFWDEAGA